MSLVSEREKSILNEIALESGEELLKRYDKEVKIKRKKGKHDYATDADIKIQEFIINELKKYRLPYNAVCEEKIKGIKFPLPLGLMVNDKDFIYVDSLEGTHNYARRRKEFGFGTTLGLVRNGYPVYVVFNNPITKELYYSIRDGGAYLNKERIHVSDRKPEDSLDIIFNHWPDVEHVGEYLDKLRKMTEYTPTSCSDAVDICMVARGSADGLVFIYNEARTWDLITALLIEEAGGGVGNKEGGSWYTIDDDGLMWVRGSMIAGNPYVYQLLLNLFKDNKNHQHH